MAASHITVTVFGAKGLPDSDWGKSNKSDGYCVIEVGPQEYKTKVVKGNLEPVWNESSTFSLEKSREVIFKIYDKDLIGSDFLGSCTVTIPDTPVGRFEDWLQLGDANGKATGELHVAIEPRDGPELPPTQQHAPAYAPGTATGATHHAQSAGPLSASYASVLPGAGASLLSTSIAAPTYSGVPATTMGVATTFGSGFGVSGYPGFSGVSLAAPTYLSGASYLPGASVLGSGYGLSSYGAGYSSLAAPTYSVGGTYGYAAGLSAPTYSVGRSYGYGYAAPAYSAPTYSVGGSYGYAAGLSAPTYSVGRSYAAPAFSAAPIAVGHSSLAPAYTMPSFPATTYGATTIGSGFGGFGGYSGLSGYSTGLPAYGAGYNTGLSGYSGYGTGFGTGLSGYSGYGAGYGTGLSSFGGVPAYGTGYGLAGRPASYGGFYGGGSLPYGSTYGSGYPRVF